MSRSEENEEPVPGQPRSLSRRSILAGAGALGLLGAFGQQLIGPAERASALSYVQYQLPFPKTLPSAPNNQYNPFSSSHSGFDFNQFLTADGEISPVASGVISAAPQSESAVHGYRVEVKHDDGMYSGYSHMVEPYPHPTGTKVYRGDTSGKSLLGVAGSSGQATGRHLHLSIAGDAGDSISAGNSCIDPISWIEDHSEEGDPMPDFRRKSYDVPVAIPSNGSTWTNLAVQSGSGIFQTGPKQVSTTATVEVSGLLVGETISIRIGRTGDSGNVVDTIGRSTVGGRSVGSVYVNVAGICDLPADRNLRLQAITTATGVTVESVDVVTHSWAG